jgi:hypothetical protein
MKVDFADELLVGLDVLKGCYGLDSRRRLEVVLLAHGFSYAMHPLPVVLYLGGHDERAALPWSLPPGNG